MRPPEEEIDVPAGQILAEQGEHERRAFLIVSGRAEILVDGAPVANAGPGSFVRETAVSDHEPRCAAVRAQTSMRLRPVRPMDIPARLTGCAAGHGAAGGAVP